MRKDEKGRTIREKSEARKGILSKSVSESVSESISVQPGKQSQRGGLLSGSSYVSSGCSLKAFRLSRNSHQAYKASCLDDFPRCHRPQKSTGQQDNKKRPCSPVSPRNEGFGVSMVNLPPQKMDRADNERRALPQESEPLGVGIPPSARDHTPLGLSSQAPPGSRRSSEHFLCGPGRRHRNCLESAPSFRRGTNHQCCQQPDALD